jgi:hypothetical protein
MSITGTQADAPRTPPGAQKLAVATTGQCQLRAGATRPPACGDISKQSVSDWEQEADCGHGVIWLRETVHSASGGVAGDDQPSAAGVVDPSASSRRAIVRLIRARRSRSIAVTSESSVVSEPVGGVDPGSASTVHAAR